MPHESLLRLTVEEDLAACMCVCRRSPAAQQAPRPIGGAGTPRCGMFSNNNDAQGSAEENVRDT